MLRSNTLLVTICVGHLALSQYPSVGLSATPILGSSHLSIGTLFIAPYDQGFLLYDEALNVNSIVAYPVLPFLDPGRLVGINGNFGDGSGDVPFDRLGYLSETLFDSDPSTLEYAVRMSNSITARWDLLIARTDGTALFYLPSTTQTEYRFQSIVNTPSGTKLVVTYVDWSQSPPGQIGQVFDLPGALPCPDCYGSELLPGGSPVNRLNSPIGVKRNACFTVFPNPSRGDATVRYELPPSVDRAILELVDHLGRGVYRIPLNGQGEQQVQLPPLAHGGYVCSMKGPGGSLLGPGQMVLIE